MCYINICAANMSLKNIFKNCLEYDNGIYDS